MNKENETSTVPPETNNIEPETIYGNDFSKTNSIRNEATEENVVQNSSPQSGEQKSKSSTSDDEPAPKPEKKGRRRGVWKRVRVRPIDSFETAESQNIGKQIFNTLISDNVKEFGERNTKKTGANRILSSPSAYAFEETISYNDDSDDNDARDPIGVNDEVQTVLPIQTTEATKDEFDLTTIDNESVESGEVTTEAIEKDEREMEATSTDNFDDSDDLTTTMMPFIATDLSDFESFEKSTEKPKLTSPSANDNKRAKSNESDQLPEPTSIMDEVKQKLTELFSFEDDDVVVSTTERVFKINRNFKRPKAPLYTAIDRNPLVNDIGNSDKDSDKDVKSSPASMKLEPVPVLKTILRPITESSASFHRDLMDSVIYATSTSTEISHETEICYRGRCVKTQKKP